MNIGPQLTARIRVCESQPNKTLFYLPLVPPPSWTFTELPDRSRRLAWYKEVFMVSSILLRLYLEWWVSSSEPQIMRIIPQRKSKLKMKIHSSEEKFFFYLLLPTKEQYCISDVRLAVWHIRFYLNQVRILNAFHLHSTTLLVCFAWGGGGWLHQREVE